MIKRSRKTAIPHLELVLLPRLTRAGAFARLRAELLVPPLRPQWQGDRERHDLAAYTVLEYYRTAPEYSERDGPWYFKVLSGGAESAALMRELWAAIASAARGREPVHDVGQEFPGDQFVDPVRSGRLSELLAERLLR